MLNGLQQKIDNLVIQGNQEVRKFRELQNQENTFGRKCRCISEGVLYDLSFRVSDIVLFAAVAVLVSLTIVATPFYLVLAPEIIEGKNKAEFLFDVFIKSLQIERQLVFAIFISPALLAVMPKIEGLTNACEAGDLDSVKSILAYNKDDFPDDLSMIAAVKSGNIEIVQLLLSEEWKPAGGHFSAVVQACQSNQSAILKLLLGHSGTSLEVKKTALSLSVSNLSENELLEVIDLLLNDEHFNDVDALNKAFIEVNAHGYTNIVRRMLKDKRVLHHPDVNSCFAAAGVKGHYDLLKELLQHPQLNPAANNHALSYACIGHLDYLKLLFTSPAILNEVSDPNSEYYLKTFYIVLGKFERWDLAEFLLKHLPINENDKFCRILNSACSSDNVKEVEMIMKDPRIGLEALKNAYLLAKIYNNQQVLDVMERDPRLKPSMTLTSFVKQNIAPFWSKFRKEAQSPGY